MSRPDSSRESEASSPPVPRETPPAPSVAAGVFASRLPQAQRLAELLATAGVERGLIGPREVSRLWERHLLNCAALCQVLPTGVEVADLGSGAGLPGLVLAVARPDLAVTLVEPMQRRTDFLEEAARELALDNVVVTRARAEELHDALSVDVVTSRALAPLPRLLGWSLPLCRSEGIVLAIKGRSAREEVDQLGLDERARTAFEVLELDPAAAGAQAPPELHENLVPTTVVRVESALLRDIPWHRSRGGGQRPRRHRPRGSQTRRSR